MATGTIVKIHFTGTHIETLTTPAEQADEQKRRTTAATTTTTTATSKIA